MDNEKKNPQLPQEDQNWLDELFGALPAQEEIGPDEQAVTAAGLTHPDELELERIVQETLAEDWPDVPEEAPAVPEEAPAVPEAAAPAPEAEVQIESILDEAAAQAEVPAEPAQTAPEATQLFTPPVTEDAMVHQPEEKQPALKKQPATPRRRKKAEASEEEKGRPKRKKGYGLFGIPHVVCTIIWLAIVIFIGTTMGRAIWLCASDLLAFDQTPPQNLTVTVGANDTVEDVAQMLKEEGLIRYPELFVFFADLTGKGEDIAPGSYTLNPPDPEDGTIPQVAYDYNALLNNLRATATTQDTVKIMFPEGYTCGQIFQLLEDNGVCSVEELEAYAAEGELDEYWFLEDIERGHKYCLEGFLAPDTYQFYLNDKPERVLEKFLDEFDDRFTDRMHQQFEELQARYADVLSDRGYGQEYIDENMLTLRDVVILASMVEKESANDSESFSIASVFFNRLSNPANYPYLNSDATINYATDYYNAGELTTDELINNSPYNTYTFTGLPAGPICNPGANSLYAALDPLEDSFYYFIYDEEAGIHRFSKTLAEHERWGRELGLM